MTPVETHRALQIRQEALRSKISYDEFAAGNWRANKFQDISAYLMGWWTQSRISDSDPHGNLPGLLNAAEEIIAELEASSLITGQGA